MGLSSVLDSFGALIALMALRLSGLVGRGRGWYPNGPGCLAGRTLVCGRVLGTQ